MLDCGYSSTTPILEQLHDSEFQFYLTGARFFGVNNEKSDWDFFTQESEEVSQFLIELGFWSVRRYADWNTNKTLRIQCPMHGQIDVQLVTNVELKVIVQHALKNIGYTHPKTSEWNLGGQIVSYLRRELWSIPLPVQEIFTATIQHDARPL